MMFKRRFKQLSMAMAALCVCASASADMAGAKLAIVYDAGGKFDKSFNQSAAEGVTRFTKETGIKVFEAQANYDTQAEQVLRALARKKLKLIISIGFSQSQPVQRIAAEYPNVHFVIVDGNAQGKNVNSILFKEQEGSYLVGVAAAMASKTKTISFVGGMDIPLIRAFACGYAQGAKAIAPKIQIMQNMVGTTSAAWNDPAKGGELARAQFDRGSDVVFAVAGGSGMGALQMAKEKGKLAIGVDSNQNYLYPGTMLSSMVKRVDNATYDALVKANNNQFTPGITYEGLKEGGVDWALDKYNRSVVTPEIEKRVLAAREDIVSGKIKVVDYRAASSCPI